MKVQQSHLLPYSAAKIYDVVADIEKYADFLPWCKQSKVLTQSSVYTEATLTVQYLALNFDFTTQNTNTQDDSIIMRLKQGPFKRFSGAWNFLSLSDDACKVSLQMEFDFSFSLTQSLMQKAFAKIMEAQMQAFEQRAHQLYVV